MRVLVILCFSGLLTANLHSEEPCSTMHGRVHYYGGDGQLRIWHIGTHHEYEPGSEASWRRVFGWLGEGVSPAKRKQSDSGESALAPESSVDLYGDFVICPSEPLKPGAVQKAEVKSVSKRHYTRLDETEAAR